MAKPIHPTLKSLRQGQTIYFVCDDSYSCGERPGARLSLSKYFLYSHNIPEPHKACVIKKLPVNHLKKYVERGNADMSQFYYSRRRAERVMASLVRSY